MGVNRFMSPVKTQYMQTAVDQHVPLPFELMQKRAEAEQKHFDANKANMQALTDKMGEDLLTIDNPAQSNAISDLRGRLDSAIDDYGGDWRKMDDVLRNVANQYNTEVKTGKLALGKHNKAIQTEAFKAVDESNATSDIKDLEKRYMSTGYNETGGIINNAEYQTIAPITIDETLTPNILKTLNELKKSGNEEAFTFYQDGRNLIVDRKEGWEGINKKRYVDAIKGLVNENPQWNDQILKEFRMKDKLGELPQGVDNLEDYRQVRLESQFLGLAGGRAHSDRNESQTSKQSAEAKAGANAKVNEQGSGMTTHLTVPMQKTHKERTSKIMTADADEVRGIVTEERDSIVKNVFDGIRNLYSKENPKSTFEAEKGMATTFDSDGIHYDIRNTADGARLIRGINDGDIEVNERIATLFGSALSIDAVKKMAAQAGSELEILDQEELDAASRLHKKGLITEDQYNSYRFNFEKSKTIKRQNKAILTHPDRHPKVDVDIAKESNKLLSLQKELDDLVTLTDNRGRLNKVLFGSMTEEEELRMAQLEKNKRLTIKQLETLNANATNPEAYSELKKYIDESETRRDNLKATDDLIGAEIKEMSNYESESNVTKTFIPIAEGMLQDVPGKTTAAEIRKKMKDPSAYWGANVVRGGKQMTLEAAIRKDALELGYKPKDENGAYEKYVKSKYDMLKGSDFVPNIANSLTRAGELSTEALGYHIEFGQEEGQIDVLGLKEGLTKKFKNGAKTRGQIDQALAVGRDTYSIPNMKGISIITDKDDIGNNTSSSVKNYELSIQPGVYGIDVSDNVIVYKDKVEEVLNTFNGFDEVASILGGDVIVTYVEGEEKPDGTLAKEGEKVRLPLLAAQQRKILSLMNTK